LETPNFPHHHHHRRRRYRFNIFFLVFIINSIIIRSITYSKYYFDFTHPNIIHTARAFCRVQNYPPDDLMDLYALLLLIVMRSDANMSLDVVSHAMMNEGYSLNAADTNL
jgi:hypothetical protein